MKLTTLTWLLMPAVVVAQGDLAGLLQSQPDLSQLLEYVNRVPGLASSLSEATNITILAPTNQAFDELNRNIPEGVSLGASDVTALSGLLSNHVIRGAYPSSAITNVPVFVQTQLDPTLETSNQPFTNFTGGQYIGLVRNGEGVSVLSGEQTVSDVTEADIQLGEGITIHKIDTVVAFGAPFQLFTARAGYLPMNGAVVASGLDIGLGNQGAEDPGRNVSDLTIFVPNNAAFEAIGSVIDTADQSTLLDVIEYHIIEGNVIFSPSITNTSVSTIQGNDLTFTVFPDGSVFVNNARILVANVILFNGVAHVIDTVLNPNAPPPDRALLDPSAPSSDRVGFPDASSVSELPFSSFSFASETTSPYTTPALLSTIAAVSPLSTAQTTTPSIPVFTGAAARPLAGPMAAGMALFAGQAVLANL